MNRTVAIELTVFTILFCGLPGIGSICLGAAAAMGSQMPDVLAKSDATAQTAILGGLMYICVGLIGLIIPFVVGFLSFRFSKSVEPAVGEPLPPASR